MLQILRSRQLWEYWSRRTSNCTHQFRIQNQPKHSWIDGKEIWSSRPWYDCLWWLYPVLRCASRKSTHLLKSRIWIVIIGKSPISWAVLFPVLFSIFFRLWPQRFDSMTRTKTASSPYTTNNSFKWFSAWRYNSLFFLDGIWRSSQLIVKLTPSVKLWMSSFVINAVKMSYPLEPYDISTFSRQWLG